MVCFSTIVLGSNDIAIGVTEPLENCQASLSRLPRPSIGIEKAIVEGKKDCQDAVLLLMEAHWSLV